jgi:hypothetical protein
MILGVDRRVVLAAARTADRAVGQTNSATLSRAGELTNLLAACDGNVET